MSFYKQFNGFQSYHTGIEIIMALPFLPKPLTFNRTILELKLIYYQYSIHLYNSFNRTILELKFNIILFCSCSDCFQSYHTGIEMSLIRSCRNIPLFFQSYHTGIEMIDAIRYGIYLRHFQSYHTGIEITYRDSNIHLQPLLSIVPYWN